MIKIEFDNWDKSRLESEYGINIEAELLTEQFQVLKKIRDDQDFDLSDEHLKAYLFIQCYKQKENDKIIVEILKTSTELKSLSDQLPGYAEIALNDLSETLILRNEPNTTLGEKACQMILNER